MRGRDLREAILLYVIPEPRTWSDIRKRFPDVPKPTMNRNLKQLIDQRLMKKMFIENKPHYYSWAIKDVKEILNRIEKNIKTLKYLNRIGLFKKGITEKDVMKFLGKRGKLTYGDLAEFFAKNAVILSPFVKSNIKIKLKIHDDPKKQIRFIKKRLKEIPKELEEYNAKRKDYMA